ncbi:hypothetical protein [Azospirillum cavernae]|uniref:hypothetical protein n=1 Tax=Azospirillum cavernae TaxID=2320860 RepID=UPI0011C4418F|nr:hypothetical protein [Azospirillum cavernae]
MPHGLFLQPTVQPIEPTWFDRMGRPVTAARLSAAADSRLSGVTDSPSCGNPVIRPPPLSSSDCCQAYKG